MTAKSVDGGVGALLLGTILILMVPVRAHGQDSDGATAAAQSTTVPSARSERGKQYVNQLFSPFSFVESAVSAGFGQWRDRPTEWRQGAAGYGRRFASSFAQHVTQETVKFGLATLLHEDNRYVPSGKAKFVPRLLYAVESTFRSRGDDGLRQVSYSNIGSLAGASLVSRTWQPKSTGSAGDGAVNFGVSIIFAAGMNVGREFFHR